MFVFTRPPVWRLLSFAAGLQTARLAVEAHAASPEFKPTETLEASRKGFAPEFPPAVGVAAAAYTQRWLKSMLFEVKPFDIATFGFAGLGVLALLVVAVWLPALRYE